MQDKQRFAQAYLALVALNWQALERIDALLPDTQGSSSQLLVEERLQWLRLELLQLRESAHRCVDVQRLSVEHQQQVLLLVRTLLDWLDFDAAMAVDIVRLRLGAAQNWLLDEAGRCCGQREEESGLSRRRG